MPNYLLHARSRPNEPPGDTLLAHIQIFCDSITTMFIKYVHILPAMSVVMKIPNKPQVSIAPFSSIILHWSAHGGHPGKKNRFTLAQDFSCNKSIYLVNFLFCDNSC